MKKIINETIGSELYDMINGNTAVNAIIITISSSYLYHWPLHYLICLCRNIATYSSGHCTVYIQINCLSQGFFNFDEECFKKYGNIWGYVFVCVCL